MKTVVLERDAYGVGRHRFHPGFLDYARHAGFLPRLCRPYRASTKWKVERFIHYPKGTFWVPFAAGMKQAGVVPDHHAANAAMSRWLREVANARVHGTTGEVPAARLLVERQGFTNSSPRITAGPAPSVVPGAPACGVAWLYGGIAHAAAKKKDVSYATFWRRRCGPNANPGGPARARC